MSNLILDFAVKVTKQETTSVASLEYIKKICIAVRPLLSPTYPNGIYLITDKALITDYTDNTSVATAFDNGATSVYLFVEDDLTTFGTYYDAFSASPFYTLIVSEDFITIENDTLVKGSFDGVVSYQSIDNVYNEYFKDLGTCFETSLSTGPIRAFSQMFARVIGFKWLNVQYLDANNTEATPITTLGKAEDLYNKRISFYGTQTQVGVKLMSFFHKNKPIAYPYIIEEIKLRIQNVGFKYVADNSPYITPLEKSALITLYSNIIQDYVDAGVVNENFTISITEGTSDAYTVGGNIEVLIEKPLWRQNILLKEV